MGSPCYVIPRTEIVRVQLESNTERIEVKGKIINVESFTGLTPDEVFVSPIHPFDGEKFQSILNAEGPFDSRPFSRRFNSLRVIGGVVLLLSSALSIMGDLWPFALGLVVGGFLVLGLLGHSVKTSFGGAYDLNRISEGTKLGLGIYVAISILPLTVMGIVIALFLGSNDPFLMTVAGVCIASAFSILVIFVSLVTAESATAQAPDIDKGTQNY
jgi:hypothetical protein